MVAGNEERRDDDDDDDDDDDCCVGVFAGRRVELVGVPVGSRTGWVLLPTITDRQERD
jgi:hypothetical protein